MSCLVGWAGSWRRPAVLVLTTTSQRRPWTRTARRVHAAGPELCPFAGQAQWRRATWRPKPLCKGGQQQENRRAAPGRWHQGSSDCRSCIVRRGWARRVQSCKAAVHAWQRTVSNPRWAGDAVGEVGVGHQCLCAGHGRHRACGPMHARSNPRKPALDGSGGNSTACAPKLLSTWSCCGFKQTRCVHCAVMLGPALRGLRRCSAACAVCNGVRARRAGDRKSVV